MKKLFLTLCLASLLFCTAKAQANTLVSPTDSWQYTPLSIDLWPIWGSVNHSTFDWNNPNNQWQTGIAPFGNATIQTTYQPENQDLALRETINIGGLVSNPVLNVASDNGFDIFVNGTQIAKDNAEGYTSMPPYGNWEYTYNNTNFDSSVFRPGSNLIEAFAEDHGGATAFDMQITADVTPVHSSPAPEPTSMVLGLMSLGGLFGIKGRKKQA